MAKTMIDDGALVRALSRIAQEEAVRLERDYQQDRLPIARQVIDETFAVNVSSRRTLFDLISLCMMGGCASSCRY